MSEKDAYLAGFFDGEGNISISPPRGSIMYLLTIAAHQSDPLPLMLFKDRFGGKVGGPWARKQGNGKPLWRWTCEADKAAKALTAMLPWLTVKRERALLALEFRELFKGDNVLPRGTNHVSRFPEKRTRILGARDECYQRMRVLNKRGIK